MIQKKIIGYDWISNSKGASHELPGATAPLFTDGLFEGRLFFF